MVSIPMEIQAEVIIEVILETILLISQDLIFLEMVVGHNAKFVTNMVILLSIAIIVLIILFNLL